MFRGGTVTAVGAATAIVVGLVVITPAAGYVGPMSAIIMGRARSGFRATAC
jgi:Amt family ammonium transporter